MSIKHADYYGIGSYVEYKQTWDEVREYLKSTYGKHKRQPMYRETNDGKGIKVGYVFSFRELEDNVWYLRQDWVECVKVEETNPFRR